MDELRSMHLDAPGPKPARPGVTNGSRDASRAVVSIRASARCAVRPSLDRATHVDIARVIFDGSRQAMH
jgi:hypothetical protein